MPPIRWRQAERASLTALLPSLTEWRLTFSSTLNCMTSALGVPRCQRLGALHAAAVCAAVRQQLCHAHERSALRTFTTVSAFLTRRA